MTSPDVVYAIHDFEAKNEDEVTLQYGEPIVILEKDDEYLDGWWHGRNVQGQTGLFPMNYTSPEKPIPNHHRLSSSFGDESYQHNRMSSGTSSASSSSDGYRLSTQPQQQQQQQESPTLTDAHSAVVVDEVFGVSNSDPYYWNVEDVVTWLESVGLEIVVDNFIDQEITGDVLMDLNHEALKELGISAYGRRYKVMNAINNLKASLSSSSSSPQTVPNTSNNRHSTNSFVLSRYGSLTENYLNKNNTISSLNSSVSSSAAPRSVLPANLGHTSLSTKDSLYRSSLSSRVTTGSDGYNKRSTFDGTQRSTLISDSRRASSIISNTTTSPQDMTNTTTMTSSATGNSNTPFPEFEGWLYKRSDRYKTWNKRWFVLYGNNLFYFKNPKDTKMKGIIHLQGYRVLLETTNNTSAINKKCYFKLYHDYERTFFFYTTSSEIKQWAQVLMKATIKRDLCVPVVSSNTVNTVPLDVAQKMKPRPPSTLMYGTANKAKEATKLYRETIKNDVVNTTLEEEELILEEGGLI
ncbi:MAG: hypothetical protein EXX96DRAFT_609496 [Benjaminiella poitrasii]|nr:MAG: hypothetical protein EXX96DRAFT_609496 [Benjaminiella poitrasii]